MSTNKKRIKVVLTDKLLKKILNKIGDETNLYKHLKLDHKIRFHLVGSKKSYTLDFTKVTLVSLEPLKGCDSQIMLTGEDEYHIYINSNIDDYRVILIKIAQEYLHFAIDQFIKQGLIIEGCEYYSVLKLNEIYSNSKCVEHLQTQASRIIISDDDINKVIRKWRLKNNGEVSSGLYFKLCRLYALNYPVAKNRVNDYLISNNV